MIRQTAILLSAVVLASPALASNFEDLAILDARVAQLGNADAIDPRIKLPRCPEPAMLDTATPGIIAIRCASLGWRLRVPLRMATTNAGLGSEKLAVRRGETVNVKIVGDSYSVSYDGVAMDDGPVGGTIRVKFSTRGGFLTAMISGPGEVEIQD
jgi:flagellar basal body P-ring formation protein FlgA